MRYYLTLIYKEKGVDVLPKFVLKIQSLCNTPYFLDQLV